MTLILRNKLDSYNARANMIIRKFSNASLGTKVMLFKAYCTQIYGCPICSAMFKYSYNKLRVACNDAFRLSLKEPRWCSASKLFVLHNVMSFNAMICKLVYCFGLVFVAVITLLFTPFLIVICSIVHRLLGDGMLVFSIFTFLIFNSVYVAVCTMGHEPAIEIK